MPFSLLIGGKLRNGALILQYKRTADHTTALCQWGESGFVTWRVDADGNAYLGHYHGHDEDAARRDYEAR